MILNNINNFRIFDNILNPIDYQSLKDIMRYLVSVLFKNVNTFFTKFSIEYNQFPVQHLEILKKYVYV